MAAPKRMSDIFASSSEKHSSSIPHTATPPYSSEGPTLPNLEATEHTTNNPPQPATENSNPSKKRKAQHPPPSAKAQPPAAAPPTLHPSLYTPWTLLPPELFKLLEAHLRCDPAQRIVPVVFSKNQNVKSGINRLKMYLGAWRDPTSVITMPEILKPSQDGAGAGGEVLIAVSAQGEGVTKLVGILDLVQRIVKPGAEKKNAEGVVETWWMYNMLSSIVVEWRNKAKAKDGEDDEMEVDDEEDEAFEPVRGAQEDAPAKMRKVPILTVWLSRGKIPGFEKAFGGRAFEVQKLPKED